MTLFILIFHTLSSKYAIGTPFGDDTPTIKFGGEMFGVALPYWLVVKLTVFLLTVKLAWKLLFSQLMRSRWKDKIMEQIGGAMDD